jgi:hypothetical protein
MTQEQEIQQELAACRAAWAAQPDAKFGWCIHHEIELELLTETIENRINYILTDKPKREQALRFLNMRPFSVVPAELDKAGAELDKAGAEWRKASAEWRWRKASAELDKASAEWNKACAKWDGKEAAHLADVPSHTWNGTSIFSE